MAKKTQKDDAMKMFDEIPAANTKEIVNDLPNIQPIEEEKAETVSEITMPQKEVFTETQNNTERTYPLSISELERQNTNLLSRQTYYLSYQEVAAIDALAQKNCQKKYIVVRNLIEMALEEIEPGILSNKQVMAAAKQLYRLEDYRNTLRTKRKYDIMKPLL